MMLYLVRHAQAEQVSDTGADESRKLTPRGREKMRAAALGMVALGLKFDVILTSPLTRAIETAELIAEAYGGNLSPKIIPALATGVPADKALAALSPYARNESVVAVGHEPQLSHLVSLLLTGMNDGMHIRFKKGACLAMEVPRHIEPAGAELRWMLTQRQLRKLGK